MSNTDNSFSINSLSALAHQAGPKVTAAIKAASAKTGVDFAYLMQKASVESGLKSDAKSSGSSASGLYQFLDKTWMGMVKKYGDKFGMGGLADKIDSNGNCSDPTARHQILSMRNDPEKAACMAAEYDSDNKAYLQAHTTGTVGSTELYLAHFMGPSSASGFLNAMQADPQQSAAQLFPKAAAANSTVFYDQSGQPRSLQSVYNMFASKFQSATPDSNASLAIASAASAVAAVTTANADSNSGGNSSSTDIADTDSASTATNDPYAVPKLADITWNDNADLQTVAMQVLGSTRSAGVSTASTTPSSPNSAIGWRNAGRIMSPSMAMSANTMQLAMMSRLNDAQRYN